MINPASVQPTLTLMDLSEIRDYVGEGTSLRISVLWSTFCEGISHDSSQSWAAEFRN
jgi:hypothetical protein